MSLDAGLYLVATPIGNLDDISRRAIDVLAAVDVIAAEDTRHSKQLLNHLGIGTGLIACHEHNESSVAPSLIQRIESGEAVALISDAGTPLVSDPGYRLVSAAHDAGLQVIPVPGASAAITALCGAGLATDSFLFVGFLPAKQQARRSSLQSLAMEQRTLVIYESCHRIDTALDDMVAAFGRDRRLTYCRELTKRFETIRRLTLGECAQWVSADEDQRRGEIVLVVEGAEDTGVTDTELARVLEILLQELPVKQAAALASKLTDTNKNECYRTALELKEKS